MKTYVLVFDDGADPVVDLRRFLEALDDDAVMYTLDGHVCFIRSNLDGATISDRFLEGAGSSLFFVADVSTADYAGRMVGPFWSFLGRDEAIASAA